MILADYTTTGSTTGDLIVGCIGVIAVLAAAGAGLRSFWRSWVNLSTTIQRLGDLADIAPALVTIAAEMSSNGGASFKDQVLRQGATLEALHKQVVENQTSLAEIHTSHETHLKLAHPQRRRRTA